MKNPYTSTLYHGQFSQTFAKFSILSPSWKLISCKQYMYPFGLEPLCIFSSPPYPNLPNSQGVVEGQHFYQAIQNGTWTAIVFARQSKTHILKSSGFWFYNIITHWGHPGKGVQKLKQNPKVEAKNRESYWTVIIAINREFD